MRPSNGCWSLNYGNGRTERELLERILWRIIPRKESMFLASSWQCLATFVDEEIGSILRPLIFSSLLPFYWFLVLFSLRFGVGKGEKMQRMGGRWISGSIAFWLPISPICWCLLATLFRGFPPQNRRHSTWKGVTVCQPFPHFTHFKPITNLALTTNT